MTLGFEIVLNRIPENLDIYIIIQSVGFNYIIRALPRFFM